MQLETIKLNSNNNYKILNNDVFVEVGNKIKMSASSLKTVLKMIPFDVVVKKRKVLKKTVHYIYTLNGDLVGMLDSIHGKVLFSTYANYIEVVKTDGEILAEEIEERRAIKEAGFTYPLRTI